MVATRGFMFYIRIKACIKKGQTADVCPFIKSNYLIGARSGKETVVPLIFVNISATALRTIS